MLNKTNKSAKTVKATETKKSANLSEILLGKFAEQFENVSEKEPSKNQRSHLYNYPETIKDINSTEGKNWRSKRRKELSNIAWKICFDAKKNPDQLLSTIESFDEMYKQYYRINDYSLASLSNSNKRDEMRDLILALDIIKTVKSSL